MSGTVAVAPASSFSSAALADAEKADIRRFCWYPTYGGEGDAGFQGWRFFQAYGLLEFRMNNLAPAEYQNVRYYISLLYPIESAIAAMGSTLNVSVAASFTRNKNELRDRTALMVQIQQRLCECVGVPPGPLRQNGGSYGRLV